MSIRTTVTLDEDIVERLKRESKTRGLSFRETLNETLRAALDNARGRPRRSGFKVRPSHMGQRPGLPYDDVAALLEYAEGPEHR
ncbi:MAG: ribbon-helix-helix domain-containing protein [Acidobacteriia bacterium]|nr:ribbon-helix-helix domain-containing protein [Terriglobia bacterium]